MTYMIIVCPVCDSELRIDEDGIGFCFYCEFIYDESTFFIISLEEQARQYKEQIFELDKESTCPIEAKRTAQYLRNKKSGA